jgi:hypothetical protein
MSYEEEDTCHMRRRIHLFDCSPGIYLLFNCSPGIKEEASPSAERRHLEEASPSLRGGISKRHLQEASPRGISKRHLQEASPRGICIFKRRHLHL